jgi:PhnB protein
MRLVACAIAEIGACQATCVQTSFMTAIQPQLWVDAGSSAVTFYETAFGAKTLHMVGDGEDIVAQLAIGDAVFWVATAGAGSERLVPRVIGGSTGRVLLVVDDPAAVHAGAVAAGASEKSPVDHEHGWLVGRVVDPYGHEWEIGKPLTSWPPSTTE